MIDQRDLTPRGLLHRRSVATKTKEFFGESIKNLDLLFQYIQMNTPESTLLMIGEIEGLRKELEAAKKEIRRLQKKIHPRENFTQKLKPIPLGMGPSEENLPRKSVYIHLSLSPQRNEETLLQMIDRLESASDGENLLWSLQKKISQLKFESKQLRLKDSSAGTAYLLSMTDDVVGHLEKLMLPKIFDRIRELQQI